jgi:hypothetical protein
MHIQCSISEFHEGKYQQYYFLSCDTVQCRNLLMFRGNLILPVVCLLHARLAYVCVLKAEQVYSSEISVHFYHTTRRHLQENIYLQIRSGTAGNPFGPASQSTNLIQRSLIICGSKVR